MFAEAVAAHQQSLSLNKDPSVTALGEAYKRAGCRGYLLKKIQILQQGPQQLFTFMLLAHQYTMLGDEAHAMNYLERAYEQHNPGIPFLCTAQIGLHSFLAPLSRPGASHRCPAALGRQELKSS